MKKKAPSSKVFSRVILFALAGVGALNICLFASTYFFPAQLPSAVMDTTQASSGQAASRSLTRLRTGSRRDMLVAQLHSSGQESIEPWLEKRTGGGGSALTVKMLCKDKDPNCESRLASAACHQNLTGDLDLCAKSCNLCQTVAEAIHQQTNLPVKMEEEWPPLCVDDEDNCEELVEKHLCASNPKLMLLKCKASCGFCSDHPAEGGSSSYCTDRVDVCPYLAQELELCNSPKTAWWMSSHCALSCGRCKGEVKLISKLHHIEDPATCADYHTMCTLWNSKYQACSQNAPFMTAHCPRTCNKCKALQASDLDSAIQIGVDRQGYLAGSPFFPLMQAPATAQAGGQCLDSDGNCAGWAKNGECTHNAAYMAQGCPMSCGLCAGGGGVAAAQTGNAVTTYLPDPLWKVQLDNGELMPLIGFGTAALGEKTGEATKQALEAGYAHIDSAQAREWYREDLVGEGLKAAGLGSGKLNRSSLFITSKVHPRDNGYERVMKVFEQSLTDLGTAYLDLLLLHYPACWGDLCKGAPTPEGTWKDTWRAFEKLKEMGKVRSIGVSNFGKSDLIELLQVAKVRPQVLQINVDPLNPNADILNLCRKEGVQVVAYSTLGTQHPAIEPGHKNAVLNNQIIMEVAQVVGKSPAQVTLRWALQLGVAVIPRSANPVHMAESLALYDFQLDNDQMKKISTLR